MSAFYVDNECMNKCVAAILRYKSDAVAVFGSATQIGTALREMNVEALIQRYGHRLSANELDTNYKHPRKRSSATPVEMLKALHCLHYQCCEGNVPETNPMYVLLETIADELKRVEKVTEESPEYQRASWG